MGEANSVTTTSDDFRSQIDQLAEVARQELIERQEGLRQRPPAKRISAILWLGGILIALEAALLGVQILYQERIAPAADSRPHPLLFADDCKGET
ncbi:MAG: hypothetical protein ACREQ9_07045, partial [Candidatus Binatia bacterium]